MRHWWAPWLVALLFVGGMAAPARAGDPGETVHFQPGDVLLIQDEDVRPGLPFHWRAMSDPYPDDAAGPLPPRTGLDALPASGSAQFSAPQLAAIVDRVGSRLIVVDLRQESHGFLDDRPVSWYADHDQANISLSRPEIEAKERRLLAGVAARSHVTVTHPTDKRDEWIRAGTVEDVPVGTVRTEADLAAELGAGYFRITATDYIAPTAENVDRFVAFAANLPPGTWLHFHCHGGDGRTTTFLSLYDIMHNAAEVTADEVMHRQGLIGPTDLRKPPDRSSWKYPHALERADLVRRFHRYVLENRESAYAVPWSEWSVNNP